MSRSALTSHDSFVKGVLATILTLCLGALMGCDGPSSNMSGEFDGVITPGRFLRFPNRLVYAHRRSGRDLTSVSVYEWEGGRLKRKVFAQIALVISESPESGVIIEMREGLAYTVFPRGDVRKGPFDTRRTVLCEPTQQDAEGRQNRSSLRNAR